MKILKFGGKSLANGKGLESVVKTIASKIQKEEEIVVVLSARGTATNDLERILEKSKKVFWNPWFPLPYLFLSMTTVFILS